MAILLIIDTSTENASLCVASEEVKLYEVFNSNQQDHASWLHQAISEALENTNLQAVEISAIGLVAGPGSYTGLRVGMAAAKGLCYVLKIPLITVNTLEAMAFGCLNEKNALLCPMIDARRMEVFTALYDLRLREIIAPAAIILDRNSFYDQLIHEKIIFFGNGKNKFEQIIENKNAVFKNIIFKTSDIISFIYNKYIECNFSDLAYVEPIYLKEPYTLNSTKS